MDPISVVKAYARKVRAHRFPSVSLSHGQALEITVSLVSGARSWNEFVANPHEPHIPANVEEFLTAITVTQRRMLGLSVAPSLSRATRSIAAIQYLAVITETVEQPLSLLWALLDAANVTTTWFSDGRTPRKSALSDGSFAVLWRLGDWFFSKRQGDKWPWAATEQLALSMGFSSNEAATIRELQREAPNHSWDLDLWFEVGVLDPDQAAFLRELKEYATDGGRGSYE